MSGMDGFHVPSLGRPWAITQNQWPCRCSCGLQAGGVGEGCEKAGLELGKPQRLGCGRLESWIAASSAVSRAVFSWWLQASEAWLRRRPHEGLRHATKPAQCIPTPRHPRHPQHLQHPRLPSLTHRVLACGGRGQMGAVSSGPLRSAKVHVLPTHGQNLPTLQPTPAELAVQASFVQSRHPLCSPGIVCLRTHRHQSC